MEPIKILIVDDHEVVRDGISVMMGRQQDFAVVGEARNGLEALDQARRLQPDLVLMDLRMPDMDGVAAMRRIRDEYPSIKFIVLTTYDSDEYIFDAIEAGAKGYLLKDVSLEQLVGAIENVAKGGSLVQPVVTQRLLAGLERMHNEFASLDRPDPLTDRETEILRLMAGGYSNKEIANSLNVAEGTVKNHVSNILSKLGVRDRTRAVLKAFELGIV
jgi:DNA-binding NarL/FixJ family response regulator